MADPSQLGASNRFRVTPEVIRAGIGGTAKGRLGSVVLTDSSEEPTSWRCSTFKLRWRERGFMALFPVAEEVQAALDGFEVDAEEDPVVLSEVELDFETARRRQLGRAKAIIADVPWAYLPLFRRGTYRGEGRILTFRVGSTLAKPTDESAGHVSQSWIADMLDEDTAQEYVSAAEAQEEADPELMDGGGGDAAFPGRRPMDVDALRTRISQLESLLAGRDLPVPGAPPDPAPRGEAMVYGAQLAGGLSPQEIASLKRAVGPAPGRLGRNEAQPRRAGPQEGDRVHQAELDREAVEEEEEQVLAAALQAQFPTNPDPFQKMLILQLKQTSDLVKALAPKVASDPLQAVLGGNDSGSAGSSGGSGGVKGYAARELFLKQIEDDNLVVSSMRKHVRQELGISIEKEEGSIMRTCLEQRIPIGDHRTMGQVGFMMAWGWEAASTTGNLQMQAFCGRMLSYVEQACLDSGRTGLAWLLTGLPEPNYQGMAVIKKRASLTPFTKLPPPTWVAANISYLKDIDTFESKLRTLGIPQKPPPAGDKEADAPVRKWNKKKKGGAEAKVLPTPRMHD